MLHLGLACFTICAGDLMTQKTWLASPFVLATYLMP
jgi:hypothetical protein